MCMGIRVWIIGDSWGDEWGTLTMQGCKPSQGLQHSIAQRLGIHSQDVVNLCRGGIGNDYALKIIETAISKGEHPPTHIIQFWTEAMRDWFKYYDTEDQPTWRLVTAVDHITRIQQENMREFRRSIGNPEYAAIGGQSPLNDRHKVVTGASFTITDWRASLLEREMDYYASQLVGAFGSLDNYPRNVDKFKTKRVLLDKVNEIIEMQAKSKAFPDNAHPGWPEFKPLIDNLVAWIRRCPGPLCG